MDTRTALLVDAFTAEPLAGNVAGVLPDATDLGADQLAAIAAELGASETAFVCEPTGDADRRLRYFTPTQEVDLCGHATVAAHAALHERGVIDAGRSTIETRVGDLDVEVTPAGTVWLDQEQASVETVDLAYDEVADALGVDPACLRDVGADLPLAVASTGMPFLVVPVNFLEHLGAVDRNAPAIEALADRVDAVGIYAFTFDTLAAESTLHARVFAPGAGIREDPVTGTGAGAVAAYLRRFGGIDLDEPLAVEQGHFLDRPGTVSVRVGDPIAVGGDAVVSLEGSIVVPEPTDDDIVEA